MYDCGVGFVMTLTIDEAIQKGVAAHPAGDIQAICKRYKAILVEASVLWFRSFDEKTKKSIS